MANESGDSAPRHRPGLDGPLTAEQARGVFEATGTLMVSEAERQLAEEINRLCIQHGYGMVPQVAKWIEARWRGQL